MYMDWKLLNNTNKQIFKKKKILSYIGNYIQGKVLEFIYLFILFLP